jgi:hypothetical protein
MPQCVGLKHSPLNGPVSIWLPRLKIENRRIATIRLGRVDANDVKFEIRQEQVLPSSIVCSQAAQAAGTITNDRKIIFSLCQI